MATPIALVAMGKFARHHTSFNHNANTHGMISGAMVVDCDEYIGHFHLRTEFPGIPHDACTGDDPLIIVSVVGHPRFGDLCTEVVNRFLLPDGDHRNHRVIVLKDDYGMRTSWVVCEYLKDLLNSILFGEQRQFNVESFLFYKECEQHRDMSRGYDMFRSAIGWSTMPHYWGECLPIEDQYGRRHIFALDFNNALRTPGIKNIVEVFELVVHHFFCG